MGREDEDKWALASTTMRDCCSIIHVVLIKACKRINLLELDNFKNIGLNLHQCHSSEGSGEIVSEPSVDKSAPTNRRYLSNNSLRNWCEGRIDNFHPSG